MAELNLAKRERQIVEALYRLGEASVADVRQAIPDPPSYSAVRAMLNLLSEKRVVTFRQEGKRYLYRPLTSKGRMGRAALRDLVRNFFSGEPLDAIAALLNGSAGRIGPEELDRLKRLVDEAEEKA